MSEMTKAPSAAVWTVHRRSGQSDDMWREIGRGSEPAMRAVYTRMSVLLRQGGVELRDPNGKPECSTWAPRLRTRW